MSQFDDNKPQEYIIQVTEGPASDDTRDSEKHIEARLLTRQSENDKENAHGKEISQLEGQVRPDFVEVATAALTAADLARKNDPDGTSAGAKSKITLESIASVMSSAMESRAADLRSGDTFKAASADSKSQRDANVTRLSAWVRYGKRWKFDVENLRRVPILDGDNCAESATLLTKEYSRVQDSKQVGELHDAIDSTARWIKAEEKAQLSLKALTASHGGPRSIPAPGQGGPSSLFAPVGDPEIPTSLFKDIVAPFAQSICLGEAPSSPPSSSAGCKSGPRGLF